MVLLVWIHQALSVRTSSLILNAGRDEAEAGARSIAIGQRDGVKSEGAIATCYEGKQMLGWGVAATKFVLELEMLLLLLAARRRRTVITITQETSRRQGRRWLRASVAKKEGCMRVLTHPSFCSSSC